MSINSPQHNSQSGFTLIELLMSLALFSFALLVVVIGFLSLLRLYQSGVSNRVTQNEARQGMDAMVQAGRQSVWFDYNNTSQMICMFSGSSNSMVFYISSNPLNSNRLAESVWNNPKPNGSCIATNIDTSVPPNYLTSNDVQVASLTGDGLGSNCNTHSGSALCGWIRINLRVTSNLSGLDTAKQSCKAYASYCSITGLSTTVNGKIN